MPPEPSAGRLLVTGVGGASGLAVAQQARRWRPDTWWADADPTTPALLLHPRQGTVVPPATTSDFAAGLIAACTDAGARYWSPNVDVEVVAAPGILDDLSRAGIGTWVPGTEAIAVCVDKAKFAEFVSTETRLSTPPAWRTADALPATVPEAGYIVKPRIGSGARGFHVCRGKAELDAALVLVDDAIIQERLIGDEFSADAISLPGRPSLVHLRRRVRVKAGMSVVAESFVNPDVTAAVFDLLAALEFSGPSCVQGFCTAQGIVLTEVNVRFGGGCGLAQSSGGRLIDRYLTYLTGGEYDTADFGYTPGRLLVRTFEGVTLDQKDH